MSDKEESNEIKIYNAEQGISYNTLQKIQHYRNGIICSILQKQWEDLTTKKIQEICSKISEEFSETLQRIIAPAVYGTGIHYHLKMNKGKLWVTEERNSWNESNFYEGNFDSHTVIKKIINQNNNN